MLTKTEKAILDRIAKNPNGITVVECGLHRGRGQTGKLREYGNRERNAAKNLQNKGLVTLKYSSHQTCRRGYVSHHTEILVKLVEK